MNTQHIKEIVSKVITFFNETIDAVETTHRNDIGVEIINFRISGNSLFTHKDGELLKSLNTIVKSILQKEQDTTIPLLIDINNYYFYYIEDAKKITKELIEKVKKTHNPVHMPPQNSFDRMLIHHFIGEDHAMTSSSEGEGFERHIVISLKN